MDSLISVIIPTYNRAHLIEESVQSVLKQTYKNLEILIIDGGSTDNTKEVVERIKDSRIRYIHQDNAGPSAARNTGLKNAQGEFIAFLDSDDLWVFDKLEIQMKIMRKHPEIGICGGELVPFGNSDGIKWNRFYEVNDIKPALMFDCALNQTALLIRSKIIKDNDIFYNTELKSAVDYDFFVRLSELTNSLNLKKILVRYRVHSNQISLQSRQNQISNAKNIRTELIKKLGIDPSQEDVEIHQSICELDFKPESEYFNKVNLWFKKIIEFNKTAKRYDFRGLNNVICQYWLSMIAVSRKKAPLALSHYVQAPLPCGLKLVMFCKMAVYYLEKKLDCNIK